MRQSTIGRLVAGVLFIVAIVVLVLGVKANSPKEIAKETVNEGTGTISITPRETAQEKQVPQAKEPVQEQERLVTVNIKVIGKPGTENEEGKKGVQFLITADEGEFSQVVDYFISERSYETLMIGENLTGIVSLDKQGNYKEIKSMKRVR